MRDRRLQLGYGVVLLLFLGLIYGWSVFVTPLEQEFSWARTQTSLVFTISISFFCLGGIAGGFILRRQASRFVLRLSALCMLAGFFLASRVQSIFLLYIAYGVICGTGVGLGYNCVLGTIGKWYPEKPGFCSGMLLLGFGSGALLFGAGAAALIGAFGWRITFVLFSILFSAVLFVGAQLVRPPLESELQMLPKRRSLLDGAEEANYSPKEILKRLSFWLLLFWATVLGAVGLSVIGHAAPIALDAGALALVSTAPGIISICNGLSRLLFGSAFDKFGKRKTMLVDCALFFLALPLLYFGILQKSSLLLVPGFMLLGLGFGGVPSLIAASVNSMYGAHHYPINLSMANLHLIFAAAAGPTLAGSIHLTYSSYSPLFPILLALSIPAVIAALMLKKA